MSIIGSRITSLAIAGVLCLGLSRKAVAQTADTAVAQIADTAMAQIADTTDTLTIETVTVTVYRLKGPATVPVAKSETKGRAPSKNAVWVPGFWDLQGDRSTGSRAGWVWVAGHWLTPPSRNAHWFPAHWGWSDDWWSWIPGHWTQGDNWIPSSI